MHAWPYWKIVCRQAAAQTFSHARTKILLGLVLSVIALSLQYFLQIRNLNDSEKIAISLIASAILVMMGSFLKHMVLVPAAMYPEPKKRTPLEEQRLQILKAAIDKSGAASVAILRHLQSYGHITFGRSQPNLPNGLSWKPAEEILATLTKEGIVSKQEVVKSTGRAVDFIWTQYVWTIESAFVETVNTFLNSEDSQATQI